MERQRIGLFGGTFNPIHSGHMKAAEVVREGFVLDKILFIPSYIPPHKESTDVASPAHRLRMIELALTSHPRFEPSAIEIEAGGKSYSILTLKKIKKAHPEALILFILGVDAFLEIETWREYRRVLDQCSFIVISRPGYRLAEAKNVLGDEYRDRIHELPPVPNVKGDVMEARVFLLPIDALGISSTEIRRRIRHGLSIRGMVPEEVEAYILENSLYMR